MAKFVFRSNLLRQFVTNLLVGLARQIFVAFQVCQSFQIQTGRLTLMKDKLGRYIMRWLIAGEPSPMDSVRLSMSVEIKIRLGFHKNRIENEKLQ